MSETSEHAARLLRAYQAQEKRFVERRFPLQFAPEVPALRELYSQAKAFHWNPETDIAWERFDPSRYPKPTLEAARRTWSRRAWGVYPGLTESTALLIRFCLESGSLGMDAKLFLSFRPAEEAKHLEVCHMLAERLGGYEPDPGEAGLARASNHPFTQAALDPDIPVEAYIAALGALDDQLDLNLNLSHLRQSKDELVRTAIRLIAGDRARHVAFAWAFLGSRIPALDAQGRAAVLDTVRDFLANVRPRRLPQHVAAAGEEPRALAGRGGRDGTTGARRVDRGAGAQRPSGHRRPGARAARHLGPRPAPPRAPGPRDVNAAVYTRRLVMLIDKERTEAYVPEQRYPLPLRSAMPDVWELWQRAKTLEWDPQTDIPWEELHPERYSAEQLLAAQMYWSRRTWGEYGAISESPALLLRFSLERRLPDLQFFFTMRTMEEGRHAEASWLMAERMGRYFPQPQNPPTAGAVGTHGVRRMAFDPETSLEGIFASLVCAAEEILIDVFKATVHKATNPAVRRLMELILRDEVRHIAFGWQCLDAWAPSFTPQTVRNIEAAVTAMIENVEFRGYRNLWLAIEGGSATPAEIDADRISCEAGLGGNTPEDEMQVFPEFLRKIRKRMAPWGVNIPMFDHPRLGKV